MKENRREILKKIAVGTAIATSLTITANKAIAKNAKEMEDCACDTPDSGPLSKYFTNAVVQNHQNRKALFYNDLLKDKIVLINFMSIETESIFHSTERLVKVQNLLGDRLGKDYFLYSITVDPEVDTPTRLKEFAERFSVQKGWSLITGTPTIIDGIKRRFFYQPTTHEHHGFDHTHTDHKDCSMGLMRYGNVKTGTWGSVPNGADPNWIIKRLAWVEGGQLTSKKPPKRRGPFALVKGKPWIYDSGNFTI